MQFHMYVFTAGIQIETWFSTQSNHGTCVTFGKAIQFTLGFGKYTFCSKVKYHEIWKHTLTKKLFFTNFIRKNIHILYWAVICWY